MHQSARPNVAGVPGAAPGRGSGRRRWLLAGFAAAALAAGGAGLYYGFLKKPDELGQVGGYQAAPPPEPTAVERLAATDAVAFLKACVDTYIQTTPGGVRATLTKRERIGGTLHPTETIRISARNEFPDQKPEVRMVWTAGARRVAGAEVRAALFAEGRDGNQITAWRPGALIPGLREMKAPVNGGSARESSRFCIRDAGPFRGMYRTYKAWEDRQTAGTLRVEYLPRRAVPEAGGRECYVLRRTCAAPELDPFEIGGKAEGDVDRDGFDEVTVFVDVERLVQVGTVVRRAAADRLVGEYYFTDLEPNPTFADDEFTAAGMKAAAGK